MTYNAPPNFLNNGTFYWKTVVVDNEMLMEVRTNYKDPNDDRVTKFTIQVPDETTSPTVNSAVAE